MARSACKPRGIPGTMEDIAALATRPGALSGLCRGAYRTRPGAGRRKTLPLGVVSSINGSHRYTGRNHRPGQRMPAPRRWARGGAMPPPPPPSWCCRWNASASCNCPRHRGDRGSCWRCPAGSINVVPGRCQLQPGPARAAATPCATALDADEVLRGPGSRICERRGLQLDSLQPHPLAIDAAPSHPELAIALGSAPWQSLGLPGPPHALVAPGTTP